MDVRSGWSLPSTVNVDMARNRANTALIFRMNPFYSPSTALRGQTAKQSRICHLCRTEAPMCINFQLDLPQTPAIFRDTCRPGDAQFGDGDAR